MSDERSLQRWSRTKRAAAHAASEHDQAARQSPCARVEEPPPVAELTLEDLTGWLRRNVPEAWRRAALRRLWVDDPMIREFIGPADYAWDWNAPDGVPGYGPLRAVDDVAKLLAQVIDDKPTPTASAQPAALITSLPTPADEMAAAPPVTAAVAEPNTRAKPPPMSPIKRRRGGSATPV